MAVELPDLPYARDALAPHISSETLDYHYGKHHKAYVDKTNSLIDGTPHANSALEDIIHAAAGSDDMLFNQSAQIWNHTFYWNSMAPNGGGAPSGHIADKINEDFGSYDEFKSQFSTAAAGQFASGWAWLVLENGKLAIRKTSNAGTPLVEAGVAPLLTIDVWEHAYYIDFRNKRPDYIATFLDNLVNWDFVSANLNQAAASA